MICRADKMASSQDSKLDDYGNLDSVKARPRFSVLIFRLLKRSQDKMAVC